MTGALSFVTAPDFEAPADAGADRVYDILVRVSDGVFTDTQAIAISILNVNEAPVITSNGGGASASLSVAENMTAVTSVAATDVDSSVTYSISGGSDASKFTINASTGALSFVTAPNFEVRTDVGANGVYDVIVRASDGVNVDTQSIAVTVTNVNEAPAITSNGGASTATINLNENNSTVTIVTSTDPENSARTYSIVAGADANRFTISSGSGVLSFKFTPDYENPQDVGDNNVYDVIVRATDGSLSDTQAIAVTIVNLNEAPQIVSNGGGSSANVTVVENGTFVTNVTGVDPEGVVPTYSISGGLDSAKFAINSATGALSFVAAPNFEAPADSNGDNLYYVLVKVVDGVFSDTQTIAVTIANANEAPVIASDGGGATASVGLLENSVSVTTVQAGDVDGQSATYAIAGGADAALFSIDSATGTLSFLSAPDFEAPADSDADNVYQVTVAASDGSLFDLQDLSVSVGDLFEDGGGAMMLEPESMIRGYHPPSPLMESYFV